MYVDGVQVGVVAFQSQTDVYSVGNYFTGGQLFCAYVDEFYMYDRALSDTEVYNLYLLYTPSACTPATTTTTVLP